MDESIKKFLLDQTFAVLSVIDDGKPYSFTVFYSYHQNTNTLIFKSSPDTLHARCIVANKNVAGCINSSDIKVTNLQGIQFSGFAFEMNETEIELINNYISKFPLSVFKSGEYWKLELNWIKYTNNKLGFGTKKTWERN